MFICNNNPITRHLPQLAFVQSSFTERLKTNNEEFKLKQKLTDQFSQIKQSFKRRLIFLFVLEKIMCGYRLVCGPESTEASWSSFCLYLLHGDLLVSLATIPWGHYLPPKQWARYTLVISTCFSLYFCGWMYCCSHVSSRGLWLRVAAVFSRTNQFFMWWWWWW